MTTLSNAPQSLTTPERPGGVLVSIGIIARNEERRIGITLESLFSQSLLTELERRHQQCEIICVTNNCTDRTVPVVRRMFTTYSCAHPLRHTFHCRVANLPDPGKLNAWNRFVTELSSPAVPYLILMDADIQLHHPGTLWNLLHTLETQPHATVSTDHPVKDIALKSNPSWWEQLSLRTSEMTQASEAQLTGQLYCIRAAAARNLYLPRDLSACDDGFIKTMICTDFLTHELYPERICRAPDASHVFEAYVDLRDIFKNQKRQMIGQTIVHVLADNFLNRLPLTDRLQMGHTLRQLDQKYPRWLKQLTAEHLRRIKHFWRLFPGLPGFRFRRLVKLKGSARLRALPAAIVGSLLTLGTAWLAYRALKKGQTDYWPNKPDQHPPHPAASQQPGNTLLKTAWQKG